MRIIIALLAFVSILNSAWAGERGGYLVRLREDLRGQSLKHLAAQMEDSGLRVAHEYELVPGLLHIQGPGDIHAFADSFLYIEPNRLRTMTLQGPAAPVWTNSQDPEVPEKSSNLQFQIDPKFFGNYGLLQNGIEKIWKDLNYFGDPKTIIAVIDTGVDYTHRDLKNNMWRNPGESGVDSRGRDKSTNGMDDDGNGYIDDLVGYDFANNDALPYDDHYHGTHVAGIAAAEVGNGLDTAGHCGRCSIMALKFIKSDGFGTDADAIRAIEYATKMGAQIINSSWGSPSYSKALEESFAASTRAGAFHAVAAGNDGEDLTTFAFYPAKFRYPGMVTVSALYETNIYIPVWSNYGRLWSHAASAGAEVQSTVPGNGLKRLSGTSMASPGLAGSLALVRSKRPDLTNQQLVELLQKNIQGDKDSVGKTIFGGRPKTAAMMKP